MRYKCLRDIAHKVVNTVKHPLSESLAGCALLYVLTSTGEYILVYPAACLLAHGMVRGIGHQDKKYIERRALMESHAENSNNSL